MIAAHKYLNLNLSVLNLGGLVLNILKQQETIQYDDLLNRVVLARGSHAKEVFLPTLNFLYLLGKIEYRQDIDTIEFKK